MEIFEEGIRKHAAVPDRSEPPNLQNAYDHQLEYSAQPPSAGDTPCVGILKALLPEGVSRLTWILQKDMSKSDVSSKQSRLLLTRNPVRQTLLPDLITSDEAALVNDRHQGLPVRVFDRLGREYAMKFKFDTNNGGFRLIGSWGCFVKCNELRVGDSVHVWAFRCRGDLGMALLHHKKGDQVHEDNDDDDFEDDELVAAEALLLLQNP